MTPIVKRLTIAAAALAAVAFLAVFTPTGHAAGRVDLECVGPAQTQYSPGLLDVSQTIHWQEHNNYSICNSSDPAISSGTAGADGIAELACGVDSVVTYQNDTYLITWNNGETSNFASTVTIRQMNGTIVGNAKGEITAGKFAGAAATSWWFYPLPDQHGCSQPPGVLAQTGVNTLQLHRK